MMTQLAMSQIPTASLMSASYVTEHPPSFLQPSNKPPHLTIFLSLILSQPVLCPEDDDEDGCAYYGCTVDVNGDVADDDDTSTFCSPIALGDFSCDDAIVSINFLVVYTFQLITLLICAMNAGLVQQHVPGC